MSVMLLHAGAVYAQSPSPAPSERVQREADNPMRRILEAARIVRRVGEPESAQAAAALRRNPTAAARAAVANATPLDAAPAATFALADPAPLPATSAQLTPAAHRVVFDDPALAGIAKLASLPQPAAPQRTAVRLVSMVPPDIPTAVQRRVGLLSELTVVLTIDRDGSVLDVSVPQAALRAVEPYITEALRQWRFEPLDAPVRHQMQLVFADR